MCELSVLCHKRKVEREESQREEMSKKEMSREFLLLTDVHPTVKRMKEGRGERMRLDIYDMTMRETRSELKPWHPRVLHAASTNEPADWLGADWMRRRYSL